MTSRVLPPKPWTVELHGIISAVEFRHPNGHWLLWCDGQWSTGHGAMMASRIAHGVPAARTMAEARTIGADFLAEVERQNAADEQEDEAQP